jgi:heat shock protein HspQ
MTIPGKLGTGPANFWSVLRKRLAPNVGDVLEIRPFTAGTYTKWDRVRVTEIRNVGGQPFYILERW